jgi:hypothetical protein
MDTHTECGRSQLTLRSPVESGGRVREREGNKIGNSQTLELRGSGGDGGRTELECDGPFTLANAFAPDHGFHPKTGLKVVLLKP